MTSLGMGRATVVDTDIFLGVIASLLVVLLLFVTRIFLPLNQIGFEHPIQLKITDTRDYEIALFTGLHQQRP